MSLERLALCKTVLNHTEFLALRLPCKNRMHTQFTSLLLLCPWLVLSFTGMVNNSVDPVKEFNKRVDEYVKLHKRVEKDLPPLKTTNNPADIATRKERLAKEIQSARPEARQGEIFSPAVRPYFMQIILTEMRGKGGRPARAAAKEGNPKVEGNPAKIAVQVNAPYPDDAPVSTVPPTLLLRLPQLPREVEYRFVGRDLILRDVTANLIIDFMSNVVPQS